MVALANNITMVVTFALRLIRAMLTRLLEGEDLFQFRDIRVVGLLVALHAVMVSMPHSSVISSGAQEVGVRWEWECGY